jgi:hypothetical protein
MKWNLVILDSNDGTGNCVTVRARSAIATSIVAVQAHDRRRCKVESVEEAGRRAVEYGQSRREPEAGPRQPK